MSNPLFVSFRGAGARRPDTCQCSRRKLVEIYRTVRKDKFLFGSPNLWLLLAFCWFMPFIGCTPLSSGTIQPLCSWSTWHRRYLATVTHPSSTPCRVGHICDVTCGDKEPLSTCKLVNLSAGQSRQHLLYPFPGLVLQPHMCLQTLPQERKKWLL